MPPTNTTADQVLMRLAEKAYRAATTQKVGLLNEYDWQVIRMIAAALSSHGLREAVQQSEQGSAPRPHEPPCRFCVNTLSALLGEGG